MFVQSNVGLVVLMLLLWGLVLVPLSMLIAVPFRSTRAASILGYLFLMALTALGTSSRGLVSLALAADTHSPSPVGVCRSAVEHAGVHEYVRAVGGVSAAAVWDASCARRDVQRLRSAAVPHGTVSLSLCHTIHSLSLGDRNNLDWLI